jgi:transposase
METISTVGLDLAKSVFHVHAIAADGAVRVRRTWRRSQVPAFFARLSPKGRHPEANQTVRSSVPSSKRL